MVNKTYCLPLLFLLSSCALGPDYTRPDIAIPASYKEDITPWKFAEPSDDKDRGAWWDVFNDLVLNNLIESLNHSNQSLLNAIANYQQAKALVAQARAAYFPTLTGSVDMTRQKGSLASTNGNEIATINNTNLIELDASWEPDLWGKVRRSIEASESSAQANRALLASTQLSLQASLAQYYFQIRTLDANQWFLDESIIALSKTLAIANNQYQAGIIAQADVLAAQSQVDVAKASSFSNETTRAQYEHAIAVLIGQTPATFTLPASPLLTNAIIPIELTIPAALLERRPDIAQAECLVAQANAQIGVATAAYFPSISLSAVGQIPGENFSHWLSLPATAWGIGPQLSETLFDGGLREAQLQAAQANYEATVANYRQTVLSAFQEVEDALVALRLLSTQEDSLQQAAKAAAKTLAMTINQYEAGTVSAATVASARISALSAEQNAADMTGQRMVATVSLIKALGGGWHAAAEDFKEDRAN